MKFLPIIAVNVAILIDEQVLLTKRKDFEVWCLQGGEVKDGESLVQAGSREILEELGLHVEIERLVGIHTRPQWLSIGSHVVVFSARITGGEITLQSDEVLEARFFHQDELPEEMLLGHRQQVVDALQEVTGAVWRHDSFWEYEPGLTRAKLYQLRDQSGLSPAEFYRTQVGRPIPGGDLLEVQGKVDVY